MDDRRVALISGANMAAMAALLASSQRPSGSQSQSQTQGTACREEEITMTAKDEPLAYTVIPENEPHGEGNGWEECSDAKATLWCVWTEGQYGERIGAFGNRAAAEAEVLRLRTKWPFDYVTPFVAEREDDDQVTIADAEGRYVAAFNNTTQLPLDDEAALEEEAREHLALAQKMVVHMNLDLKPLDWFQVKGIHYVETPLGYFAVWVGGDKAYLRKPHTLGGTEAGTTIDDAKEAVVTCIQNLIRELLL